jgi:hypothetical protein
VKEIVKTAIENIHAHASLALSYAASENDGRAFIRVRNTLNYAHAQQHVAALRSPIIEAIGNTREATYRIAHEEWAKLIPLESQRFAEPKLTTGALARIRSATLHGKQIHEDVANLVEEAGSSLLAALSIASKGNAGQTLKAWKDRQIDVITHQLQAMIVSSQTFADVTASRDLIKEDLLTPEAIAHGGTE